MKILLLLSAAHVFANTAVMESQIRVICPHIPGQEKIITAENSSACMDILSTNDPSSMMLQYDNSVKSASRNRLSPAAVMIFLSVVWLVVV